MRHGARPPDTKELHYFDKHAERGALWYNGRFPPMAAAELRAGRAVTGEATPFYVADERACVSPACVAGGYTG